MNTKPKLKLLKNLALLTSLGFSTGMMADVRLSDLQDLALGTWNGVDPLQVNDDICIALSTGEFYSVVATGQGSGNEFELANGVDNILFEVFFNDDAGTNGNQKLSAGITLSGQSVPKGKKSKPKKNNKKPDCNKLNANLAIIIPNNHLQQAQPGAYSGNLTLTVIPE